MLCLTSVVFISNNNNLVVNAQESSDMVYVGTPINSTGTYDKIYFNTSLSFDSVDNILNNLDYGDIEQYYIYLDIDSSNMPIRYIVINRIEDYVNESGYAYSIRVANQSDNILIYNSQNYQGNVKGFRNFDNPLGITFSGGIEQLVIEGMTIIVGQQNELLSSLISSTPFEYVSVNDTEWKGTAINPTGTYDKVYFNTSLSVENVDNILNQLTYIYTDEYCGMYSLYTNNDFSKGFVITKLVNVGFTIDTMIGVRVYDSYEGFNDGNGNPIENPYTIELSGGVVEVEGVSIGFQNEYLSQLVSSTPFYRVLKPVDNTNNNKDIVTDIFETGKEALTGLGGLFTDGVDALVSVFYINNELTIVGVALAIGAGVGVLYLLFNLIKNWLNKVKGG